MTLPFELKRCPVCRLEQDLDAWSARPETWDLGDTKPPRPAKDPETRIPHAKTLRPLPSQLGSFLRITAPPTPVIRILRVGRHSGQPEVASPAQGGNAGPSPPCEMQQAAAVSVVRLRRKRKLRTCHGASSMHPHLSPKGSTHSVSGLLMRNYRPAVATPDLALYNSPPCCASTEWRRDSQTERPRNLPHSVRYRKLARASSYVCPAVTVTTSRRGNCELRTTTPMAL